MNGADMTETGTFLERRAALAALVAIPIAAISAVLFSADDWDDSDERLPCDGCGELCAPDALTRGELGTRWCSGCVEDSGLPAALPYDLISEDDGDL